jgi:hypothetical protein
MKFFACLTVLLVGAHGLVQGDDALIAQVKKNVAETQTRIEASLRPPVRARTVAVMQSPTPGASSPPFGTEFYTTGGSELLKQTVAASSTAALPGKGQQPAQKATGAGIEVAGVQSQSGSVFARNPRYLFGLSWAGTADSWLLTQVGKTGESQVSSVEQVLAFARQGVSRPADQLLALDGVLTLDKLFESDGFQLGGVSQSIPGGVVTVVATRAMRDGKGKRIECKYTFDPASGWLPVEWSEKVSAPDDARSMTVSRKYTLGANSYQHETKMQTVLVRPQALELNRTMTYVIEPDPGRADAEFTLPAYGIPEPDEYKARGVPLYVWLLGGAAVLLGLTAVFWFLARKRSG